MVIESKYAPLNASDSCTVLLPGFNPKTINIPTKTDKISAIYVILKLKLNDLKFFHKNYPNGNRQKYA